MVQTSLATSLQFLCVRTQPHRHHLLLVFVQTIIYSFSAGRAPHGGQAIITSRGDSGGQRRGLGARSGPGPRGPGAGGADGVGVRFTFSTPRRPLARAADGRGRAGDTELRPRSAPPCSRPQAGVQSPPGPSTSSWCHPRQLCKRFPARFHQPIVPRRIMVTLFWRESKYHGCRSRWRVSKRAGTTAVLSPLI
jgi:hypothetical protein